MSDISAMAFCFVWVESRVLKRRVGNPSALFSSYNIHTFLIKWNTITGWMNSRPKGRSFLINPSFSVFPFQQCFFLQFWNGRISKMLHNLPRSHKFLKLLYMQQAPRHSDIDKVEINSKVLAKRELYKSCKRSWIKKCLCSFYCSIFTQLDAGMMSG